MEWKFALYAKETVIPGSWSEEYVWNAKRERGWIRIGRELFGEC